jgi:putative transposase
MAVTNDMLDELIGNAKTQEDLFGNEDVVKDLSKKRIERVLDAEMTHQSSRLIILFF